MPGWPSSISRFLEPIGQLFSSWLKSSDMFRLLDRLHHLDLQTVDLGVAACRVGFHEELGLALFAVPAGEPVRGQPPHRRAGPYEDALAVFGDLATREDQARAHRAPALRERRRRHR